MIRGYPVLDVNAYLGHWFARRVEPTEPDGLTELMDRNGIERAVVGSLEAVMYRNCQSGNEELARRVERHRDRLIPFGVLNPAYIGWERDLDWCVGVLGARGVRIYPQYHGYTLADTPCAEVCAACAERSLPLTILQRQEDYRQRHPMVDAKNLALDDIAALASRHPATRLIVMEGAGYARSRFVREASTLPRNTWIEISRSQLFLDQDPQALIGALGGGRLLFGSGMPLKMPRPAVLVAERIGLQGEELRGFLGGNLEAILRPV